MYLEVASPCKWPDWQIAANKLFFGKILWNGLTIHPAATINCSCLRHLRWCLTQIHSSIAREGISQKRHCLFTYCNRRIGAGAHKCGPTDSSANAANSEVPHL
jgi:hypothetical protein